MKSKKKHAILFTSALLLSACGNGDDDSASSTSLEIFSQKPEMQSQLQAIIDDFNEDYEADLELVSVPDSGTVLRTRIANNDTPDIINIFPQNTDFQQWSEAGEFIELSDESFMDNIVEGAAEEYAVNDGIYSLPLTTNAWGFFYNEDRFNDLSLDVPETWAEFEQLVEDINNAGEVPFAGAFSTADSWTLNGYHQLAWAQSAGGYDGANDYLRHSEPGAISTEDSEFQRVTDQLSLLIDNAQGNSAGASYNDAIAAFTNEDALIMPNGIWALPAINEQNPDFTVRSFAYPGENPGEQLTVGAADLAFSISESTSNPELALEFLEYMSDPDVLRRYYEVDGMPTSLAELQEDDSFEETNGITQYTFTDQQMIWLHQDWDSEEGFWHTTVDFINGGGDEEALANSLNQFFDPMK